MATLDRLIVKIEADIGQLKRELGRAQSDTIRAANRMGGSFNKLDQSLDRATTSAISLRTILGSLGVGIGLVGIVAGMRSAVTASKEFGAALSELSALTGATGADLAFLENQAKEIGRTTTKSAQEALTAFKLIASAKPELLETPKALAAITKEAVTLAEATGLSLPKAADALTTSLNQFQAGADEASRFINVLAAGAQLGAAEVPKLAQALIKSGTVANQAGIEFEELNALLQKLAAFKTPMDQIGTSSRNILLILQKGTDQTNPAVVGLTKALKNLGEQNLSVAEMTKLFGQENVVVAQQMILVADVLAEFTKQLTGTTQAYDQAATATDNLKGDLALLANAVDLLKTAFVDSDGAIRDVTQGLTEAIKAVIDNIDIVQNALLGLGAGATVAAILKLRNAVLLLNVAFLANPVFAVASAIALLTTAVLTLRDKTGDLTRVEDAHAETLRTMKQLREDAAGATDEETTAIKHKIDALLAEAEAEIVREEAFIARLKAQSAMAKAGALSENIAGDTILLFNAAQIAEAEETIAVVKSLIAEQRDLLKDLSEGIPAGPPAAGRGVAADAPSAFAPSKEDIKRLEAGFRWTQRLLEAQVALRAARAGAKGDLEDEIDILKLRVKFGGEESEELRVQLRLMELRRDLSGDLAEGMEEQVRQAEALRTKLEELEQTVDPLKDAMEDLGSVVSTSFEDAILSGEKLDEVLRSLALKISRIALRAFATKRLEKFIGDLASGIDFGSIFSNPFGSGFEGIAHGGMIRGPGGPTSDNIPIMASPGEFMVNARATAAHRSLLEVINAGISAPRLAHGGAVAAPAAMAHGGLVRGGDAGGISIGDINVFVPPGTSNANAFGTSVGHALADAFSAGALANARHN